MKPRTLRLLSLGFGIVLVQTLQPSAFGQATLTHRYSFNDTPGNPTFADSVGGVNWTGTNVGTAVLDGSQLQLDGGGWAQVPGGIISAYTTTTIEFWLTAADTNPFWTRVFAFGDQVSSAENTGLDYCHYAGGNWQNLNIQIIAGAGTYANNPAGLNGQSNVHVTVVVDPPNNNMYYFNGTTLLSTLHGPVPALSGIHDTLCLLGKSLFDVDAPLTGSLNEFRVYNGIINTSALALNDAAGPDNIVTNPGPVQALHFSSPANPLIVNQISQQILTGDFTNLTGLDLISYGGATFSSQNTSIMTINSNGVVRAIAPGTTKVVASFGGLNATNTLTVVSLPAVLAHRYSFTTDASDSVGGANGTIMGTASVSGGQLVLDGNFGSYVDLPGSTINIATNSAVTIEAWVSFGNPATWAYLFGFGNTNNGAGVGQLACVPASEGGGFKHWGITENFANGSTLGWSHAWGNTNAHITCVVDPTTSTISIYRDGVLELAQYNCNGLLSSVPTNYAFIGRSFYDADPYLTASIDEYRIYSGALTPAQVALTDRQGPNVASIDVGALSSIVVVPTNYPAYSTFIPPVIFANYANLPNFNLVATVTAGQNATLTGPQGLLVTSSDPSIISVTAQNMLTTHRPGTVTLSASYQNKTSSATVTVKNLAVLAHRYSFTTDASDSVGGANGTLQGAATVSGGALQLTGQNTDYLDLPPTLLNDYSAVTVDMWVNFGAAQNWARLWEFTDAGSATQNELYFAPGWNNPPNGNVYNSSFPWGASAPFTGVVLQNATFHITCLYGNGSMEVYTNGVLESRNANNIIAPASAAGNTSATIGHSPFNDPGINGAVDELRIYRGRLAPDEIQALDVIGPNTLPTTTASVSATRSGGNVVLSWPVAAAGFSVQARSSLGGGGWTTLTNAPALVGSTWQVTVPATGTAQFYRIWR
jgi:hypothetical protein